MADDRFLRGFGMGKHEALSGGNFRTRSEIGCGREFYRAYAAGFERGVVVAYCSQTESHKWTAVALDELHCFVG